MVHDVTGYKEKNERQNTDVVHRFTKRRLAFHDKNIKYWYVCLWAQKMCLFLKRKKNFLTFGYTAGLMDACFYLLKIW